MQKSKRIILNLIIILLFGLFIGFFISNNAGKDKTKSWDFEKWKVDIEIDKDGTFLVKEAQTFNFRGNFHWVTRDVLKQRLRKISQIKVFDETGKELSGKEIEIKDYPDYVNIKLNFDLTDTQKTWVFQYRVHGGLGFFGDYDELYWNAVSSEREVPIKDLEVFVYLPEEVPENEIKQLIYLGASGSKEQSFNYEIKDGKTMMFWGSSIGPYKNFTVLSGWPKGIISEAGSISVVSYPISGKIIVDGKETNLKAPAVLEQDYEISSGLHEISVQAFGWEPKESKKEITVLPGEVQVLEFELQKTSWLSALSFLPFLVPAVLLVTIIKRWQGYAKVDKTIIAQYRPPVDLGPLETGALVDANIQSRDLTAVIIDLAFRGYLKIREKEESGIFGKKIKYSLIREDKFSTDYNRLKDYEKDLFKAIFSYKKEVDIDDLQRDRTLFYDLQKIKDDIFKELVKSQYYKFLPGKEKIFYIAMLALTPMIGFFLMALLPSIYQYLHLAPALIISELLFLLSLIFSPIPFTEKGAKAKWQALGFKEYLQVAERFRLGACTPETFEKYLSYAIVFKVEEKWADRFADIYKVPPSWFESARAGQFSVVSFGNSMSSFSASFSSAVAAGTASSSSGFGGGGGAGGGGGGGGSGAG